MGLVNQFLPPYLKPLRDDVLVIGRTMAVVEAFSKALENGMSTVGAFRRFGIL